MEKSYVVLLFEVAIKEGKMDEYLEIAVKLKEDLFDVPGFLSIERFTSLSTEGKLLSMSTWESEDAVSDWRNNLNHRLFQKYGRDHIFEDYKITVSSSIRTYTMKEREEAPADSNIYLNLPSFLV